MDSIVSQNLNNEILDAVKNNFLEKVHNRSNIISNRSDDMYVSIKSMGYETHSPENIRKWNKTFSKKNNSNALTNEILQQLVEDFTNKQKESIKNYIDNQIKNLNLVATANPQFMISKSGKYFRLDNCDYIEEPSIINIDENGNYTVKQKMEFYNDYLVTTYDTNNRPISLKIMNQNNKTYKSELYAANKLNLKKEYVKKYKLHGYCGNSSGFTATIKNFLSSPIPSGYYFYKSYKFFKWNKQLGEFQINIREGNQIGSPLLADYEIKENIVIRTDYDGAGICL